MDRKVLVILVALAMYVSHSEGLKFLMILNPVKSHLLMFSRMGTALVDKGHSVSMILPDNVRRSLIDSSIHIYTFQGVGDCSIGDNVQLPELALKLKFAASFIEHASLMMEFIDVIRNQVEQECTNFNKDMELRTTLLAEKFDFAMVDSIGMNCVTNHAITLGLEYFIFSVPQFTWNYRVPELPSMAHEGILSFSDDLTTFWGRFKNTLCALLVHYVILDTSNPAGMTEFPSGRSIPYRNEIHEDALLWFWLADPALAFAKPQMPNIVNIGDIMIKQINPLPEEFQEFLDDATGGAILLSFGSVIRRPPADVITKICAALSRLPQKVIWKVDEKPSCVVPLSGRVMTVSWMPQNDILAHPNLKLFITHCGWNSMLESLYHAKPMLGFPITFDQPANSYLMEQLGYGLSMDLAHFTDDELYQTINRIITSDVILQKVQLGSALLKDKRDTAGERIDYWVNHVAKYGNEHLKTAAFKLKVHEFLLLDVYAALAAMGLTITAISIVLLICVCKCLKRCCCGVKSSKVKRD